MLKLFLQFFIISIFISCQKDSKIPIVQKEIYIESKAVGNPIIKATTHSFDYLIGK